MRWMGSMPRSWRLQMMPGGDGAMDPSSSGGGSLGGVGFRDGALHLVVYLTDSPIRDPDEGDPSPGGCAFDAGMDNVVAAASALDARIMGVWGGISMPETEASMDALAVRTGSVNAEGEAMVFDWGSGWGGSSSSMREAIMDMSEDMLVRDFWSHCRRHIGPVRRGRIDSDKETGVHGRRARSGRATVHPNLPSEAGSTAFTSLSTPFRDGWTALGTGRPSQWNPSRTEQIHGASALLSFCLQMPPCYRKL